MFYNGLKPKILHTFVGYKKCFFEKRSSETMKQTDRQYDQIISQCREQFINKMKDYGLSWRILRLPSLTDQLLIKANRVRTIEEKGKAKVDEGIIPEFQAMVNYSIMALIQIEQGVAESPDGDHEQKITAAYDKQVQEAKELMNKKNHDYGEAWRLMNPSSFTDLILTKIYRIKNIEANKGKTVVSEGVAGNYLDILNYAVFALIILIDVAD